MPHFCAEAERDRWTGNRHVAASPLFDESTTPLAIGVLEEA